MADRTKLDTDQMAAYFALMEVGSLIQHAVEHQLRESGGLSYTQFQILAAVENAPHRQLRMTDIADRLVYSRSALTYQVTRLADARLVTREPADDDERGIVVTVTPQGRAALARALPGHVEVVQRLLMDPLTGPETVTLGDVLGRVRDHARALPPRSVASRRRTPPDRGGAGRASDTQ